MSAVCSDETTRPVGQEVKTGASHAPNVGSIPARVTISNCPEDGGVPQAALPFHAGQFDFIPSQTKMKRRFILERRNREAIRSFRRQPKARGGNGASEADFDEVGVNDDEGPPVPIPNTEVKLVGGENTCLATDREDSTMPTQRQQLQNAAVVFFMLIYYRLTALIENSIIDVTNRSYGRTGRYDFACC